MSKDMQMEVAGGYLSYVDRPGLNSDSEPELAIKSDLEEDFAILYGARPEDFAGFQTIEDCYRKAVYEMN